MAARRILSDKGDAVMVTAVLLLSLAVSVGGRLLISYGEAQGKEMDMEHLDDVQDSLQRTRGSMYTLLDAGDTRTQIVNRITLGTFGNPYLAVARSSGTLSIRPDPTDFTVSVLAGPSGSESLLDEVSGSIVFEGSLYYYQDQDYHFEGGAVIVDQGGFRAISSPPAFELRETPGGFGVFLSFYGMAGGAVSLSGIETIVMKVRMESYTAHRFDLSGDSVRIRVNSNAEMVWRDYFLERFKTHNLVAGADYVITNPVDWTSPAQFLDIELRGMDYLNERMGIMEVTI
jgi:hypothetical protein